jgi:apolipoprotein N-acyltransferase
MDTKSLLLALLAGLLTALALPNELFPRGNVAISLIALMPYFLSLYRLRTAREASACGALYGGVSTFLSNYWLMFFGEFSVWTIGGVTLAYILFHALLAPFLHRFLRTPSLLRPFALAVLWTAYEYLKSIGFLGYPWGLIGYPAGGILPLMQHVDVTGVWSLSFFAAGINALIAESVSRLLGWNPHTHASSQRTTEPPALERRSGIALSIRETALRQTAVFAVVLLLMLGYGWQALSSPLPTRGSFEAVLIQQNEDSWERGNFSQALRTAQRLTEQALADHPDPALIAWSETSLRYPYRHAGNYYDQHPGYKPFTRFLADLPAPLLTGAPYAADAENDIYYNGAILLDQDGELRQYYGKQHLVPFAEHIPFWEFAAVRSFFQQVIGITAIWTPASEHRLFGVETDEAGTVRFGAPICFEDAFTGVVRGFRHAGADVIINLTNNSWSRTESAQIQHYVAARFRAVETRTALVRSTNSGLTGVVDGHGRLQASLPMFERGSLAVEVPVYDAGMTVYTRYGDYLPQLFLVVVLGVLIRFRLSERTHAEP